MRHLSRQDDLENVERAVSIFLANDDAAPLAETIARLTTPNRAGVSTGAPEARPDHGARTLRVEIRGAWIRWSR